MGKIGYLILENGDIFEGVSIGFANDVAGEVVFNTGMVGYPESFTDPSYYGQILTLTYPLIGNYGVPAKFNNKSNLATNFESDRIQIRGLIISSYVENDSHWQSKMTLSTWLKKYHIPALSGIDTRTLTKIIREYGVVKGIITFKEPRKSGLFFKDINQDNIVKKVSCLKPEVYQNGKMKIIVIDCGLKFNQIRQLLNCDVSVIRVPWDFNPFRSQFKNDFSAIVISNGPGDPKKADKTIEIARQSLQLTIPTLGICLGNQILALAAGASTYKLKYGHRGQNQPVKDLTTGKCYITTHNHGFTVDDKILPTNWFTWFTNLNDHTNEGIRHKFLPFYATQFHPEDTPGPTDTRWIFPFFLDEVKKWYQQN